MSVARGKIHPLICISDEFGEGVFRDTLILGRQTKVSLSVGVVFEPYICNAIFFLARARGDIDVTSSLEKPLYLLTLWCPVGNVCVPVGLRRPPPPTRGTQHCSGGFLPQDSSPKRALSRILTQGKQNPARLCACWAGVRPPEKGGGRRGSLLRPRGDWAAQAPPHPLTSLFPRTRGSYFGEPPCRLQQQCTNNKKGRGVWGSGTGRGSRQPAPGVLLTPDALVLGSH